MITLLLKGLGSFAAQAFATFASKEMIEWVMFKLAEAAVKSTKTEADDEWLVKFKDNFKRHNK